MTKFFGYFLLVYSLSGCSSALMKSQYKWDQKTRAYILKDKTGTYSLQRQVKLLPNKLALKHEVLEDKNQSEVLEKTITVSKLGKLKGRNAILPETSQHTVWLEGKRYFSQTRTKAESKMLEVITESPEEKQQNSKNYAYPKSNVFCYFSQIPECVKLLGFLSDKSRSFKLFVLWDTFPYHLEMYENVSPTPFSAGVWAFDEENRSGYRYGLVVDEQLIIYEFDNDLNFKNMFWVAQGISINREEEE